MSSRSLPVPGLARLALATATSCLIALFLSTGLLSGAPQLQELTLAPTAPQRIPVLIELHEDPAALTFARVIEDASVVTLAVQQGAAAEAQLQVQRVVSQQQQAAAAIASRGIPVAEIYRVQKSMNAIAAEVDGARIAALRQVPGVKAVHILDLEYPMNSSAVPFTATPPVWGNTIGLPAGATGTGVRIAIIDTGVDYLHATFGGSGLLADYSANNRTTAPDAYYPNAKVVGGTDFAGDTYNGTLGSIAADPDPMDCHGHGSHVAGTAAGLGVNSDGTTYTGSYDPSTPFGSMRIGPGTAPHASIYALRVFGCGGGTTLTVQAIEWAMDPNGDSDMSDRVDVINLSLGSALGSLSNTSAIAAENAAATGIIVVAAAGNSGDTYTVNGAPSVANRTISVGASVDTVGTPDTMAGFSSRGPAPGFRLKPDITAPGQSIISAQTGTTCTGTAPSTGCQRSNASGYWPDSQSLTISGTSMATPHVAGIMALLRQLHPDWSVEQLKALVMNTATHDLTNGSGVRYGAGRTGAGRVDASNAALSKVVAFSVAQPGSVSVSFDTHIVHGVANEEKRIRLVNTGSVAEDYVVSLDTVVDAPGMAFDVSSSPTITVPAHGSVEIPVFFLAQAGLMDHAREATVSGTQTPPTALSALGAQTRHWITEETGYVTLHQGGNLKLRVPLYAMARPGSAMSGSMIETGGAPTGSGSVVLSGTDVCTGTSMSGPLCAGTFNSAPYDVTSLASPFQLQAISPRSPLLPASADLQYGGVAYDATATRLMFGVSMWGAWSSPSDTSVNIYIDNNNDGTFDRILFDGNSGSHVVLLLNANADPQDTFISLMLNIANNGLTASTVPAIRYVNGDPSVRDSALFNSSVRVLSAAPAGLGITGPFHYKILTCPGTRPLCQQRDGFHYDEESGGTPGGFLFDSADQGLNFNGASLVQDLNTAVLPVTWNTTTLTAQGSPGGLLLHHHNGSDAQAELLPITGTSTTDLSVSIAGPGSTPTKGSAVALTISATNSGSVAAVGTTATIELPAGLTYYSDDGAGSFNPTTAQWTIGSLAAGATETLHLTATLLNTDAQVVTAFVSAQAPLETVLANNRSSLNVMAPRDADLRVTSVPSVSSVTVGGPVTYTVTVTNLGDDSAFDVNVGASITAGAATFGAGTVSAGTFNSTTGAWKLSSLGKGITQTLTFTATALSGPTLTTRAIVTSTVGDLNTANNVANASTTVLTRATSTAVAIAASVTAGQLTPLTVVVADTASIGAKSNPTGTVGFASSVLGDAFIGTCTLAAVAATTDQSSCEINARFDSSGPRTVTATYGGSAVHATSQGTAPSSATCAYAVTPGTLSFSSTGGSSSASVQTASGCPWTSSSNAAFTTVTAGASGSGNGTVNYTVAASSQAVVRNAILTIAGQGFTVNQGAATAMLTLDRSSLNFGATRTGPSLTTITGAQTVTVQINSTTAAWTASADQPWIQISPAAGSGTGSFDVSVASNVALPVTGVISGTITVSAPDTANTPQVVAVRLTIHGTTTTTPPVGHIDTPVNNATGISGGMAVTGWAIDDVEVTRVLIYRDPVSPETFTGPVYVGDALFIPDARPDVELVAPGTPFGYRAGWGMVVLTNTLPGNGTGTYTFRAVAQDREGHAVEIGARTVTTNNATATVPFGTLDTPYPGEVVSGVYANFGWALTPLPKTIPFDGSTLAVVIDGVVQGSPSYNHARPDIAGVFPGLNNSAGPVGAFVFDSRTMTNGLHTISWIVVDDSGATTGIGSRYFKVQNNSGSVTDAGMRTAVSSQVSVAAVLRADEVGVRRAITPGAPVEVIERTGNGHVIAVRSLEPIEVHIGGDSGSVSGYSLVGGDRRRLPVGSTLDEARGIFFWQPGAGFNGQYELVFERAGVETRIRIQVQ